MEVNRLFGTFTKMSDSIEFAKKRYNRLYVPLGWQDHAALVKIVMHVLRVVAATPLLPYFMGTTILEANFCGSDGLVGRLLDLAKTKWIKSSVLKFYIECLQQIIRKLPPNQPATTQPKLAQYIGQVLNNLIKWHPKKWWEQAPVVELTRAHLSVQQAFPDKDQDGLLLLDDDHAIVVLFESIFASSSYARFHWREIPPLSEYVHMTLRSRQAKRVLWRWFGSCVSSAKTRKAKQQARDKAVTELLGISKSAIHLRVVYDHLVKSRQDLLDEFINAGEPYYGVFFLEPGARRGKSQLTGERVGAEDSTAKSAFQAEQSRLAALLEEKQQFVSAAKDGKQPSEGDPYPVAVFDHEDLFRLPTYYKLRRLVPAQSMRLGVQLISEGLNADRPLPNRLEAMIRWTLLPSTTYVDIINFLQKYQDTPSLTVNLVEALIRGCMYNDEVVAPMHYLLDPQFLSSDRSRVAAYAISKCIPYISPTVLSSLLEVILSTKRRHSLKVTVAKEIVRLLVSHPTTEHIDMIVREWTRQKVHRDVKITIMKAAFKFLDISREVPHAQEGAWRIFDSAMRGKNAEVILPILGAHPVKIPHAAPYPSISELEGLTLTPRILEHLDTLTSEESAVATRHCQRFGRSVILKLCKRIKSKEEEEQDREAKSTEKKPEKAEKNPDKKEEAEKGVEKKDADESTEKAAEKGEKGEEKGEEKGDNEEKENKKTSRGDNDLAYLAIAFLPSWAGLGLEKEAASVLHDVVVDYDP